MPFAAGRAKGAHVLLADAQEGADLALDAAVDFASGRRANEDEVFHDCLHRRSIATMIMSRRMTCDAIKRYAVCMRHKLCRIPGSRSRKIVRICGRTAVSSSFSTSSFRSCRRRWPAPWTGNWPTAAAEAGALGSLPCAMLNADQIREQMAKIRARTKKPINLNFFCHTPPVLNNAREARWRERLAPYYQRTRASIRPRRCLRATGPRSMLRCATSLRRRNRRS